MFQRFSWPSHSTAAQDQPTSHACVVTTHYTASFKIIQHATDDSLYSLASKYPFRH